MPTFLSFITIPATQISRKTVAKANEMLAELKDEQLLH
jgi:hypothetical protein